jgi:hypothetical protein
MLSLETLEDGGKDILASPIRCCDDRFKLNGSAR